MPTFIGRGAPFADADQNNTTFGFRSRVADGSRPIRNQMKISQAFRFEAAHRLPNVPETHRCHRLHGHSYRVEVQLDGPVDPRTGFVVDFFDVERCFADIVAALDHRCLNDVEGLDNPTAENIAIWIWDRLQPSLRQIFAVRVFETADCWAEYQGR